MTFDSRFHSYVSDQLLPSITVKAEDAMRETREEEKKAHIVNHVSRELSTACNVGSSRPTSSTQSRHVGDSIHPSASSTLSSFRGLVHCSLQDTSSDTVRQVLAFFSFPVPRRGYKTHVMARRPPPERANAMTGVRGGVLRPLACIIAWTAESTTDFRCSRKSVSP